MRPLTARGASAATRREVRGDLGILQRAGAATAIGVLMLTLLGSWAASAFVTHCSLPRGRAWRVAFIGDSITRGNATFGQRTPDGPAQWRYPVGCWPCELQAIARTAGVALELRNLAVWGSPVMDRAQRTSGSTTPFPQLLDGRLASASQAALSDADIVLVMIGTNDGRSTTADIKAHFEADLQALTERLFAMRRPASGKNSSCAWLMVPPLVHGGAAGMSGVFGLDAGIVRGLAAHTRAVAAAVGVGVIDVRTPLETDWRRAFGRPVGGGTFDGDGVHPPPVGMRIIAEAVWRKLVAHNRRLAGWEALETASGGRRPTRRLQGRRPTRHRVGSP